MALPFPMPATMQALREAAVYVQTAWIQAADETVALSPRQRALYVAGLTQSNSLLHPFQGDPLHARVQNLARLAPSLETGTPAVHLPSAIRWATSKAARRSKSGRWYLIIPFTHAAYRGSEQIHVTIRTRMMTKAVYQVARTLRPGQRLTAGPSQGNRVHAPGLHPYVPAYARNLRPGYVHAAKEEGMVRRPTTGKAGQYLTFRTMTSDSPGWWLPPRPGLHLARAVEQATKAEVQTRVQDAVRQDVVAYLQQQLGG